MTPDAFVSGPEKHLVTHDRPAGIAAELIEPERRRRQSGGIALNRVGVQDVVTEEMEHVAVILVAPGLGDHLNRPTESPAVTHREVVGMDDELGDRV